jgi:hypothetical protein
MEQRLNRTKLPIWLVVALILPALLSAYSIYRRNQAESLNRATSFAVEYETIENLAAAQGVPIDRAIADLKQVGLNSVVISEETVSELLARGRVVLATSYVADGAAGQNISSLRFTDPRDLARVQRALTIRLQSLAGPLEEHAAFVVADGADGFDFFRGEAVLKRQRGEFVERCAQVAGDEFDLAQRPLVRVRRDA